MKAEDVHPSHKMEDNDYGSDRHSDMNCTVCGYSHCVLCLDGEGMDDDELKEPCIGFKHWNLLHDGDKVLGRRSGTGWF